MFGVFILLANAKDSQNFNSAGRERQGFFRVRLNISVTVRVK